ncbi:MAG: glycosyltransferase family 4 protein [Bryobacterales bacterium]|nr:glycosyltransferase family 4 protein [Bryobacterales bacterium]
MSPPGIRLLAIVEAATVTGPAKNLLEFCRAIRQPGIEPAVSVEIGAFLRGKDSEFLEAARAGGMPVHPIVEQGAFDGRILRQLRVLAARSNPDIIQTHAVKSHFLTRLSGIWKRHAWVAFHHGYTATDLKMRLYNQLDRWSLRAPRRICTVSHAFERQLLARGVPASRITVVDNAIDAGWWRARVASVDRGALRRQLGIGEEEKVIIAIGRLSREKAHIHLVRAFERLRTARGSGALRLVIAGDGPERQILEQAAGEGVLFAGQVRDPAPYFAIADVMALPSLSEGSPNVLLEAMAAGVPVVATRVGGIPEMVEDGVSALLAPPADPPALAAAIGRLLDDPSLAAAIVDKAGGLLSRRYSPLHRARTLAALYAEVLSTRQ